MFWLMFLVHWSKRIWSIERWRTSRLFHTRARFNWLAHTSGRVTILIRILVYMYWWYRSTLHPVRSLWVWRKILTNRKWITKEMKFPIKRDSSYCPRPTTRPSVGTMLTPAYLIPCPTLIATLGISRLAPHNSLQMDLS